MYFNDDKFNTDIDDDFENDNLLSRIIRFIKKYQKILIAIVIIIIIAIIFMIYYFSNQGTNNIITKNITNYLVLNGDEEITIYQDSDYIEAGFEAYNSNNEDLTTDVIIKSNLNTSEIGEYEITYTIGDVTKTRKVTVTKKPKDYTYIYLKTVDNNVNVYLKVGEQYTEPGYQVFSSTGKSLTNEVKVTGSVDTSKKGSYKLIYSVVDSENITISVSRTVIVMDTEISLSLDTQEYTNKDVNIIVNVIDDYFDYLILPDNTKVTKNSYSYSVSQNGTYKFTTYSKKGIVKEASIEVTNIDKTAPTGSCSGSYKDGKSTINITASDNVGIYKYTINDIAYTNNTITINKELEKVTVTIQDKSGNTKDISCTLKNNNPTYDSPINPKGNENIIHNISSNTLNVWIEKYSTYYVTHIWAKDPYNQFKSAVPENFGSELKTAKNILNTVISTHNYQNKIIVAVNGSGFVLKNTYDTAYYSANNAWNKTSVSPIVIVEGNVLRDISNGKFPSNKHITYGMKKDGTLAYYQYSAGTNLQSNINTSQQIINDGVLNTFAFNPVLVLNGKAVSSDTSPNIRQGFCQIDKNNFIFITNTYNRSTGFSFKSLGEYMVSLGCQTGFNLDGGGSTTLLIKDSSNNTSVVVGNSRAIADIVYFHEQ